MEYRVTYLYNSGFLIERANVCYIIDYCGSGLDPATPDGAAVHRALHSGTRVIAMATHAHGDHFQPVIVEWARMGLCELVLGSDIEPGYPARYLSVGESTAIGGITITAYGSTDQGVSFHIADGTSTIYHAGDLNDWHWQAESTPDEINAMHQAYMRVLSTLPKHIDLALFPVDPRMGEDHERGAAQFVETIAPKYMVPMHFRDDAWAAESFALRQFAHSKVVPITQRGQQVRFDLA